MTPTTFPRCEKCGIRHAPSGITPDDGAACLAAHRQLVQFLMSRVGEMSRCKGCGAVIWWITHLNGKNTPYNEFGQIHFVDCERRESFRRPTAERV